MVEFFLEGYLIGPPCLVLRNKFTDFGDEILMNNLLKKENIITKKYFIHLMEKFNLYFLVLELRFSKELPIDTNVD